MNEEILIIDDMEDNLHLLSQVLKSNSYKVIQANNGPLGIDLAIKHKPDVIICDIMMPDMDGYEVFESLRKIHETARIPFIFLSAMASKEEIREGMNLGADDYLTKPLRMPELLKSIETRLQKKNLWEKAFQTLENNYTVDELKLLSDLKESLTREEIQLYYQPKFWTATKKLAGAEVLLRWNHNVRGWISPASFIPLAEKSDLILEISKYLSQRAIDQVKKWQKKLPDGFRLALNFSASEFQDSKQIQYLRNLIQAQGLSFQLFEVEITETSLIKNFENATNNINQLRAEGIEVSVDDFGTGYSSLAYLKQFSLDSLKIDKIFVNRVSQDPKNGIFTKAIIDMSHHLGLKVIGEGVETEEDFYLLREMGCDIAQGYLLGRPVPSDIFEKEYLH